MRLDCYLFVDILVYLCIFERVHEINNKLVGMYIRVMTKILLV